MSDHMKRKAARHQLPATKSFSTPTTCLAAAICTGIDHNLESPWEVIENTTIDLEPSPDEESRQRFSNCCVAICPELADKYEDRLPTSEVTDEMVESLNSSSERYNRPWVTSSAPFD
jgi:hypothetical protein